MSIKHSVVLGVVFLSTVLCFALWAEEVKINSAEIEWHKYYDNVYISTSSYIRPRVKKVGKQIILEFEAAQALPFIEKSKRSTRIRSITTKTLDDGKAQVIIDLKKHVEYECSALIGKDQVIIELSDINEEPIVIDEANKNEIPDVSDIKIQVAEPMIEVHRKPGSKSLRGKIIVVDPGHGGSSPGAKTLDGVYEKFLTLCTAKYLSQDLRARGAKVFMTRTTDVRRELPDIVEFANNRDADLYVAVHFNAIENKEMSGTETYYNTNQSFRLASFVHRRMVANLKRPDRGIKRAKFYTIHHAKMPAILVEPVYITDAHEYILAKAPSFQKEIAESIAEGIEDYYSR